MLSKKTLAVILTTIGVGFISLHLAKAFYSIPNFTINQVTDLIKIVENNIKTSAIFIPNVMELKVAGMCTILADLFTIIGIDDKKKYRKGKEYGSARWGTKNEIKKLKGKENIILSQDIELSLDTRKTRKNLNTLVIGGSGTGKTRSFVIPNLLQANTSFVVTDPKGEIYKTTKDFLTNEGYRIKKFNLCDMRDSDTYNPFAYVRSETDVLKLINTLIKNTGKSNGGDPFWEKSETALLQAIIFYLVEEGDEAEQNFSMVMELLRSAEIKEDEEDYESPLDILFQEFEEQKPEHIAVKQYKIFKQSSGKTAKSILISVGVRLSAFNIESIERLTSSNSIDLASIGEVKTALFIITPDTDDTFNYLACLLYTQLFETLVYRADNFYNGRLPIHVRCILDEFSNIGMIPNFDILISTIRSREISVVPIVQNLTQLKKNYKEAWEIIQGNCDSTLFLGGEEDFTLQYMAKKLGKETIDLQTTSSSRGKNKSNTLNYNIQGRELMTGDEIRKLSDDECLLLVRGLSPFLSKKFNMEKHKNYKAMLDSKLDDFEEIQNTIQDLEELEIALDKEEEIL